MQLGFTRPSTILMPRCTSQFAHSDAPAVCSSALSGTESGWGATNSQPTWNKRSHIALAPRALCHRTGLASCRMPVPNVDTIVRPQAAHWLWVHWQRVWSMFRRARTALRTCLPHAATNCVCARTWRPGRRCGVPPSGCRSATSGRGYCTVASLEQAPCDAAGAAARATCCWPRRSAC